MPRPPLSGYVLGLARRDLNPRHRAALLIGAVECRTLWSLRDRDCRSVVLACNMLGVALERISAIRPYTIVRWLDGRPLGRETQVLLVDGAVLALADNNDLPAPDLKTCRALTPPSVRQGLPPRPAAAPVTCLCEVRAAWSLRR